MSSGKFTLVLAFFFTILIIWKNNNLNSNMISAVVITRNEEKNIEECLKTISWCDELIVIDDNSSDKTVEIISKRAKVFVRPLNKNFAQQRNYGLEKAKEDWVFFVDADEIISDNLAQEIKKITSSTDCNGFYIKRDDFIWGKELKHGETGDIKLLRLAKRNVGKWTGEVHEEWKVKGKIGILKNSLIHYPHRSIDEFLRAVNFYSSLRAQELYNQNTKVRCLSIIAFPLGKFIVNYFFKLGFIDGIPGLIYAIMMSFHSFLVRAKLWFLWETKKQ